MIKLNNFINNEKLLKEEVIKSKIEDSYQVQLTDYIYLQKKISSIKNLLIHKPKFSLLDYTKLNRYYNFSKSIIISKKINQNDDIELIRPKSSKKSKGNDDFNKILYLSNPILKKIFLSNEESPITSENTTKNSRSGSAFTRYNGNLKKRNKNKKTNYINYRAKNDLYKLPKQIKNTFKYNLTDLKNNIIKRKYQIKEAESEFDRYSKYFLRGLSLSEEQNLLYQRCKKIDLSLTEEQKNKNKYGNIHSFDYKRKKLKINTKTTRVLLRHKNNETKNGNNIQQNHDKYILKYSLKNLINTENPIKILL